MLSVAITLRHGPFNILKVNYFKSEYFTGRCLVYLLVILPAPKQADRRLDRVIYRPGENQQFYRASPPTIQEVGQDDKT